MIGARVHVKLPARASDRNLHNMQQRQTGSTMRSILFRVKQQLCPREDHKANVRVVTGGCLWSNNEDKCNVRQGQQEIYATQCKERWLQAGNGYIWACVLQSTVTTLVTLGCKSYNNWNMCVREGIKRDHPGGVKSPALHICSNDSPCSRMLFFTVSKSSP